MWKSKSKKSKSTSTSKSKSKSKPKPGVSCMSDDFEDLEGLDGVLCIYVGMELESGDPNIQGVALGLNKDLPELREWQETVSKEWQSKLSDSGASRWSKEMNKLVQETAPTDTKNKLAYVVTSNWARYEVMYEMAEQANQGNETSPASRQGPNVSTAGGSAEQHGRSEATEHDHPQQHAYTGSGASSGAYQVGQYSPYLEQYWDDQPQQTNDWEQTPQDQGQCSQYGGESSQDPGQYSQYGEQYYQYGEPYSQDPGQYLQPAHSGPYAQGNREVSPIEDDDGGKGDESLLTPAGESSRHSWG